MSRADTICAISTPAGVGGIAVVRLSGADAKKLAEGVLRKATGRPLVLADHRAMLAHLMDGDGLLDEVVATFYAAPHSYSGEDTVEIACHGSLYIQQQVLTLFVRCGARLAEPGEFTLRAFLNGRMDLSQAEAVADLIDSQSQMAHRLAVSQMRGGYAQELEALRQQLIDLAALMELELDFSEEDLEFANRQRLNDTVDELTTRVRQLTDSYKAGNAFKRGIPVAIVGRPNAGKSSLLNSLLAEERAIVSDIPGTTRDTIEETMTIDGYTFRFIDTAGLRQSDDPIESMGFDRAIKAAQQAHIILFTRDITIPFDEKAHADIDAIADKCEMSDKHLLIVHNKCDKGTTDHPEGYVVSAKCNIGIDTLKQALASLAAQEAQQNEGILVTNLRHYEAMQKVLAALNEVKQGLAAGLTPDLVTIDIRDALYHLGTITGKISNNEILSSIFSRFCIGK